eukprot:4240648-Amphidinium_carterae.1
MVPSSDKVCLPLYVGANNAPANDAEAALRQLHRRIASVDVRMLWCLRAVAQDRQARMPTASCGDTDKRTIVAGWASAHRRLAQSSTATLAPVSVQGHGWQVLQAEGH